MLHSAFEKLFDDTYQDLSLDVSDVYKRQVAAILLLAAIVYLLNILSVPVAILIWTVIIVFCLRGIVNGLETVSYTHLDVYKRQGHFEGHEVRGVQVEFVRDLGHCALSARGKLVH